MLKLQLIIEYTILELRYKLDQGVLDIWTINL